MADIEEFRSRVFDVVGPSNSVANDVRTDTINQEQATSLLYEAFDTIHAYAHFVRPLHKDEIGILVMLAQGRGPYPTSRPR